jgi:hypothetical protein
MNDNPGLHAGKRLGAYQRYWTFITLLIVILFTILIRLRLLEVPFERDEGEYAYGGQLILQGEYPYAKLYSAKMPGVYAIYAIIMAVFGQTQGAIHWGLLIINTATIFLMYLLGRKLLGQVGGVVAATAFAILSLGQYVQGVFANAEHFVIFFAVSGILLLVYAVDSQKWVSIFAAAVLLGLAFLMKQHGGAFVIFGGIYLLFTELRRQPFIKNLFLSRMVLYLIGVLLPYVAVCLIFWKAGVFGKFWFWTFDYARKYVTMPPLFGGISGFKTQVSLIVGSAILLWLLAGVGLIALWQNTKTRQLSVFTGGFLLFSFLGVSAGFYFRPHYFILLLPAVALLVGTGVVYIEEIFDKGRLLLKSKAILALLGVGVLLYTVYQQRYFFFVDNPTEALLMTYYGNPFIETREVGRFIRENSKAGDRIAVIGSEPEIFFYSGRCSATGYIYTYPLMEPHNYALQMQKEMIEEIEAASPEFVVFMNDSSSWLQRPESEMLILKWFKQYQQKYYHLIGVVDIMRPTGSVYRWNQGAIGYSPQSENWIHVFRRNSGVGVQKLGY